MLAKIIEYWLPAPGGFGARGRAAQFCRRQLLRYCKGRLPVCGSRLFRGYRSDTVVCGFATAEMGCGQSDCRQRLDALGWKPLHCVERFSCCVSSCASGTLSVLAGERLPFGGPWMFDDSISSVLSPIVMGAAEVEMHSWFAGSRQRCCEHRAWCVARGWAVQFASSTWFAKCVTCVAAVG